MTEPALCGECGVTHRPGENTLCPGWRPGPYVAGDPKALEDPHAYLREPRISLVLGNVDHRLTVPELEALLLKAGFHIVSEADVRALANYRDMLRADYAAAAAELQRRTP